LDAKIRKILAIEKNGIITNKAAGKRLLFYVAARANELSPENIEFISRITGFNNDWLCGRIAQLKRGMENKDRRINHYIERKNRLFCRVILLEKKLIRETDNGQKEIILRQLKKTKALFTAGLKKIERATTYPSHREIAAILGVPKGTVDTSLYRLKNIAESV